MPKAFNNNPRRTVIGGSAAYKGNFHKTPYYSSPTGNYFQPNLIRQGSVGGFGSAHNTLSSILGVPIPPLPSPGGGYMNPGKPCPMSPFSKFLDKDQQESLHELITEARRTGASESDIKVYIERYVKEILSPEKYRAFQKANADFERRLSFFRRGKRSAESVQGTIPSRFDQATFRSRKTKKIPEKIEFPNKNVFLDYTEVPRGSGALDDLVELI